MSIISYLFTVAVMAASVGFTVWGFHTKPRRPAAEGGAGGEDAALPLPNHAAMTRADVLPLGLICLAYAAAAFIGLGNSASPQSFYEFRRGEALVLELSRPSDVGRILYFTGADVGAYSVGLSADGTGWTVQEELDQDYAEVLKWHELKLEQPASGIRYVRISAEKLYGRLSLGELALFDGNGGLLAFDGQNALTDEQGLVPASPSYMNSTYFDEIYHVRTAWENINNVYPYEISHPPLGKLIISLGIRLFGLTPFGWRFMGAAFGVLMLPPLYALIKRLFGDTLVSCCGVAVFAFDFMHFVQTRIATIDTYGVFFILAMYYFMYLYYTQPYDAPLKKTLPPLFLSGLFFGIGAACKWTAVYGGAGLGLLWLLRQAQRLRYGLKRPRTEGRGRAFLRYLPPTVACSVLFFIVIPAAIYALSYFPYAEAKGIKIFSIDYLKLIWENQKYMFGYHSKLTATHPYESRWWKWLIDLRPILYYLEYFDDGTKSAFAAFGNPLFWWTGLGAMICMLVKTLRGDRDAGFILIGYLSTLLPWVFIRRCTFIYHYFPCTVFMAAALSYMFSDMCRYARLNSGRRFDWRAPAFAGACAAMFIIFYPVLTGLRFSRAYTNTLLRWFGGQWPF